MWNVTLLTVLGAFLVIYEAAGKVFGVQKPWGTLVYSFLILVSLTFAFFAVMRSMHDVEQIEALSPRRRRRAKQRLVKQARVGRLTEGEEPDKILEQDLRRDFRTPPSNL